jgi:tetratricopeptide (TPR) repeat protein
MQTPVSAIWSRVCASLFYNSQIIFEECHGLRRGGFSTRVARFAGFLLVCLGLASYCGAQSKAKASAPSAAAVEVTAGPAGSEACAKCHAKISGTYASTAMARASGPATQEFLPGEFQHAASGVRYRVYLENGEAWLSFDREGGAALHGKRKLEYFVGSGHRGKTFLFTDEQFAFESPINFYSQKGGAPGGVWDMAPAYQDAKEMPLNLPAASSCLTCHTSDAQAPMPGTENKYGSPLFAHAGITCERCHGGDVSHGASAQKVASSAAGKIAGGGGGASAAGGSAHAGTINPAKLTAVKRDSVCMQCHLEGNAAIEQPGRHLYEFRPGDDLAEFVRYYILTGDGKENVRAVSQFEALAQSGCKRAAGDMLTCTSCHDPHSTPAAAERVAYYRGKCLACHGDEFAAKHHVEKQDCAACHMLRLTTVDVAHTQASDHRILRVPLMPLQGVGSAYDSSSHGLPSEPALTLFPPTKDEDSPRDLALAWVALAGTGSRFAFTQAGKFLPVALSQTPDDPELLAALGYNEQRRGMVAEAREHYEHALRVKPLSLDAAANLAVIEANAGNVDRAIGLWKSAFERAPGRSALGLNMARALCLSGKADESKAAIARVLEFNPDMRTGREMLKQLESGEAKCVAQPQKTLAPLPAPAKTPG